MRLPEERFRSWVVVALSSVVLCFGTVAAHGQQELPAIRHVAPEVAARGDITTVRVEGTLPSGFWLRREPRVRVTDASGTVVELLPILRGPPPQIKGYRGVTTGHYVPGVYQVRAELDYIDPDGAPGAAVSPWTTLTVPPPGAEERPTIRHVAPVLASPGRDTTVTLEFTLPPGYELLGGPRVVAINEESALVVLLSTYITQAPPDGKGYQKLGTWHYPPGIYRLRAEIDTLDPDGQTATEVSPWTTLTVPPPAVAKDPPAQVHGFMVSLLRRTRDEPDPGLRSTPPGCSVSGNGHVTRLTCWPSPGPKPTCDSERGI